MSNHRESKKPRKLKTCLAPSNNSCYPSVTFQGTQSIEIPQNTAHSPVATHVSLLSNPEEFKFMDEIALLKRGRIDKDAPKHPYNRGRYLKKMPTPIPTVDCSESSRSSRSTTDTTASPSESSRVASSVSFLGGNVESEKTFPVGKNGSLKHAQLKGGGERYDLSCGNLLAVYQQGEGQTCLFTYSM